MINVNELVGLHDRTLPPLDQTYTFVATTWSRTSVYASHIYSAGKPTQARKATLSSNSRYSTATALSHLRHRQTPCRVSVRRLRCLGVALFRSLRLAAS